ncbi:DNA translocase FtsK [Methylobacterium nigriterrae]|uniref:DNA translocase FtsK n=1 Tax=Methylobacterium nigriterrae TaxID=3127512 RepID=UPI0030136AC0
MSLRASLSRRLAGAPPRPSYAIAGTRPAPSWLTAPNALVGRGEIGAPDPGDPPQGAGRDDRPGPGIAHRALATQGWPAEIFDDRASPEMLAPRPESRIDMAASSPGVLIRSPRRPAAITPETAPPDLASALPPLPGASLPATGPAERPEPAVRYTRTPDTVLQERRQRALDAERAALAQAQAEAQAALRAIEAERAASERAALEAAEAASAEPPVPLWRQPFVPPPGVRFFRTPDRRPAKPAAAAIEATRAEPEPVAERDWSEVSDWSAVQPWYEGQTFPSLGDWSSAEAWAAVQAEAGAGDAAAAGARTEMPAEPSQDLPADRFVSVPLDISLLRALPPNPVYVLERLVRFDGTRLPRPADAQDNGAERAAEAATAPAARPALSLVFGPGADFAARDAEPSPVPAAEAPRPGQRPLPVSAMAARAAIRAARPPGMPAALPEATPTASRPAPIALPIPPRPVLLRSKAATVETPLPAPMAAPDLEEAATDAAASEPAMIETAPAQTPLPAPALPVVAPRAVMPEPRATLIPAGRHLAVSVVENADYEHPSLELLALPEAGGSEEVDADVLEQNALNLQQTVQDFGVRGDILAVRPGPVVTLYELEPAPGTKSSRVIGLSDDIARSMSAVSARVAVVPGRNVIGIELPNETRETVYLRELLASPDFAGSRHKLALCLGKNIGGEPIIADLARMPHLLVAGTTGSGKSVAINTMILSLLYRLKPEECRLIMVDPKMLELSVYDGIPHLLSPVVIDPKKAVIALKWAVREMEERYKKMSKIGVRNIDGYNARMAEARAKGEVILRTVPAGFNRETGEAVYEQEEMDLSALPYIVIVVDEMADLMMVAGKEIEGAIQRLAQMARAAGIHLIMATQRPSVDVITGTIKANFPTRISFQVTSKIDSRTILGEMGAEQLLGQGDMLFMAGGGRTTRVHGPFCSDLEVESVVAHLKRQGRPAYLEAVTADDGSAEGEKPARGSKADKAERAERAEAEEEADAPIFDVGSFVASSGGEAGDLYEQAIQVVLRDKKASTSYIQRRLQIGYNRAASIMEKMEIDGIVGPANHAGKREILVEGGPSSMMPGSMMYDDD